MMNLVEMPDHKAWLRERATGIGASEVPVILGLSRWSTPTKLWAEKVALRRGEEPAEDDDDDFRWYGTAAEPLVVERFKMKEKLPALRCSNALARSRELSWAVASPDALVMDPNPAAGSPDHIFGGVPFAVLEAKTAVGWKADEWKDEPPLPYIVQANWQMFVTGLRSAYVAALVGGAAYFCHRLDYREDFISAAMPKLAEFWRHVTTEEPPPVPSDDETRVSAAAYAALWPTPAKGSEIVLPDAFADLERRYLEALARKDEAEQEIGVIQNWVRREMKTHETAIVPGGGRWTWKLDKGRKGYVVEPVPPTRVLRYGKAKEE